MIVPVQIQERPMRLALSGGGFRATLFSLGSLLYLVDSGQNKQVGSIYSVSGASVLNGLLAQEIDFTSASVREVDEVAVQLLRTITGRGLLLSSWVTPIYLVVLIAGLVFLVTDSLFSWPLGLTWWQLSAGVLLVASFAILRGHVIVQLLSRQFFRKSGRPTTLGDVTSRTRHTLCATDLNSAKPAYFSTGGDSQARLWTGMGRVDVSKFRLDHAVRASAAFPGGIPPKRISLSSVGLSWSARTHRVPPRLQSMSRKREIPGWLTRNADALRRTLRLDRGRSLFLADGGVFNNLATDEVPGSSTQEDEMLLVVDASAPLDTKPLRHLAIPVFAEAGNIARSMSVLYENTVEPRVDELVMRGALILRAGDAASKKLDFPVVVRITDNTSDGIRRLRKMRKYAGFTDSREIGRAMEGALRHSRRQWNKVADYMRREHAHSVMAARSPDVPTTFGRIGASQALGLMLHGYLATMIALTHTRSAANGELDMQRFERLLRFEPGTTPGFDDHLQGFDPL